MRRASGQHRKKLALITAIQNGAGVLAAVDKYERDKDKQGLFIQLDHKEYRSLVNICFPEVEQEIINIIKSRYTQLMQTWNQELKNILGEIQK